MDTVTGGYVVGLMGMVMNKIQLCNDEELKHVVYAQSLGYAYGKASGGGDGQGAGWGDGPSPPGRSGVSSGGSSGQGDG